MSSDDPSVDDHIANQVLQESYCDIIENLNVYEVSARLYPKYRITLSELDQLQNVHGILTDLERRHILYSTALAGKGKHALDAFLDVLDETAIEYKSHTYLANKLRVKFKEHEYHYRNRTFAKSKRTNVLLSSPDVFTHQSFSTIRSLPGTSSIGASVSSTMKSAQMPPPSYAFTTSSLNTNSPSSMLTSLNDVTFDTEDSSHKQEVQYLLVINDSIIFIITLCKMCT